MTIAITVLSLATLIFSLLVAEAIKNLESGIKDLSAGSKWMTHRIEGQGGMQARIDAIEATVKDLQAAVKSLQVQQQPVGVGIGGIVEFCTPDLPKWEPLILRQS